MSDPEKYIDEPLFDEDKNFDRQAQKTSKMVAFGGYVKPEMYDIFGNYNLVDLSEAEKDWMTADRLRAIVFDTDKKQKMCVDGIALNAYEYNLIVRSPKHLGMFATAHTLRDNDLNDELIAKSNRAPIHIFEQKLEDMTTHYQSMKQQKLYLRELYKEATMPGYAHKTPERMKQLTSSAWNEFTTILDVAHIQREWDDEKRHKAEASLANYLTHGSQRERVKNWKQMITLADNYVVARVVLFDNRIKIVKAELNKKIS